MRKRAAFTLVEMLVSMALILFVMVILSQAFTTGLQVFRQLKGLGDMEERLRSAAQTLRRDLSAYHFENHRRLSDPGFWTPDGPPQQGFFRIWQGGSGTTPEGVDGDNIPSARATNHFLHFTSKLSGLGQGDFATSTLPTQLRSQAVLTNDADNRYQQGDQFRGRWYEVVYFMQPTGQTTGGTGDVALNTLYRRQLGVLDLPGFIPSVASRLSPPTTSILVGQSQVTDPLAWTAYSEISCKKTQDITAFNLPNTQGLYPDTVRFSSPADLTMPARRFGMLPAANGSDDMAGIPADPIRPSNVAPPISQRFYPFLGEIPDSSLPLNLSSPWRTATAWPFFSNPPSWQGNGSLQGADMLLTDVISFEVKALFSGASDFSDIPTGRNLTFQKAGVGVFDTWSSRGDDTYDYSGWSTADTSASAPLMSSIIALKITIRLWDAKTQQARQISIIQDM